MKKIAIFTEGQTEQIFVEKLLIEIAGAKNVHVEAKKAFGGGGKIGRMSYLVKGGVPADQAEYFALLWDCASDSRVTSDVKEQYDSLVASGYSAILAVRDVRPDYALADIPRLKSGFASVLPKNPFPPELILAAMEIEAWFLSDLAMLASLDPSLTPAKIFASIGYDLETVDLEAIAEPAKTLDIILSSAGLSYLKDRAIVQKLVGSLDFETVIRILPIRAPEFAPLARSISSFFA